MAEEKSVHRHHHSHSGESHSSSSKTSHHSKGSKSSSGRPSKSRKKVGISIAINIILLIAVVAIGIMSGGLSVFGIALFAMFNLPLLFLAYYSLKLRKIPSYEYKADVYKNLSSIMLTIGIPIGLVLSGVLLVWGITNVDNDLKVVNSVLLIIGGLCGLIGNGLSSYYLKKCKEKTVACKTVYDNSLVGCVISIGTMIAGIALLSWEKLINADPYATILISLVIAITAIKVLHTYVKRGFHMIPHGLEIEQVISTLKLHESVKSYRHLNIWTNNAEEIELSAHLSLDDMDKVERVKRDIKDELRKMGVDVVTLAFKKHKEEE